MANEVKFVLSADEAKAVQGFLKVIDVQRKTEQSFEKAVSKADGWMGRVEKTAAGVSRALSGLSQAGAAAGNMMQGHLEWLEKNSVAVRGLDADLKNLLAEGNNVDNIRKVKDEVLLLSNAFGLTTAEVANMRADVQNGMESMGEDAVKRGSQMALRLNAVLGGAIKSQSDLVIKAYQAFGDELGGGAEDKLFKFATGLSGIDNPAEFFSKTALSAKQAKISADEFLGTMVGVTQLGGDKKRITSAAAALFEGVDSAAKAGAMSRSGDWIRDLRSIVELMNRDPATFAKYFGSAEPAIRAMADKMPIIQEAIKGMQQATGGGLSAYESKLNVDAGHRLANMQGAIEQFSKNQPPSMDWLSNNAAEANNYKLNKIAAKKAFGEWGGLRDLIIDTPVLGELASGMVMEDSTFVMHQMGANMMAGNLADAGRQAEADALLLEQESQNIYNPLNNKLIRRSNAADAQRYAQLRAQYGNRMTLARYLRLAGLEETTQVSPGQAGTLAGMRSDMQASLAGPAAGGGGTHPMIQAALMMQSTLSGLANQIGRNFTVRPRPYGE